MISKRTRHVAAMLVGRGSLLPILLALLVTGASGQTAGVTDGKTPSGLAPGAPAGSYGLSGFGRVDLFNGNLNSRLPLISIGGRGSAGSTMMLPIEQKVVVRREERS